MFFVHVFDFLGCPMGLRPNPKNRRHPPVSAAGVGGNCKCRVTSVGKQCIPKEMVRVPSIPPYVDVHDVPEHHRLTPHAEMLKAIEYERTAANDAKTLTRAAHRQHTETATRERFPQPITRSVDRSARTEPNAAG